MFCPKCGAENESSSNFCQKCGVQINGDVSANKDDSVGALGILFFLFPLIGWIMYFVWKEEKYFKAKKAASVAWAGFIVGFFINILISLASM